MNAPEPSLREAKRAPHGHETEAIGTYRPSGTAPAQPQLASPVELSHRLIDFLIRVAEKLDSVVVAA